MFWSLGLENFCSFCFTLLKPGVHTIKKSEMKDHEMREDQSFLWWQLSPGPRQPSAECAAKQAQVRTALPTHSLRTNNTLLLS